MDFWNCHRSMWSFGHPREPASFLCQNRSRKAFISSFPIHCSLVKQEDYACVLWVVPLPWFSSFSVYQNIRVEKFYPILTRSCLGQRTELMQDRRAILKKWRTQKHSQLPMYWVAWSMVHFKEAAKLCAEA
jgi:hypothetical protein